MASVEIRGMAELGRKLAKLDQAIEQMADPTRDALDLLTKRMQDYPPPPPNSTYDRTDNLKNSWEDTIVVSDTTIVGTLFSTIVYGPYVQDEEMQAEIHQGRWQTTKSVAEEEEGNIVDIFEREIERLINE